MEKNTTLLAAKKSRNKEKLELEIKTTTKNGTDCTVHSFKLSATLDKDKETGIRRLDGITCFITNEDSFSPSQVIQKYRYKNKRDQTINKITKLGVVGTKISCLCPRSLATSISEK